MRRLAPLAALALGLAAPAAAQEPPRDDARADVAYRPGAEVTADHLVLAWARRFGAVPLIDRESSQVQVRFLSHVRGPLTWGVVKEILAFHQVRVLESRPSRGSPWLIRAVHERNLLQRAGGELGAVVPADELPAEDGVVTAVLQVRHGGGQQLFAALRGIQSRDRSRFGNILFLPGPELLLITDRTPEAERLVALARALDVPGPQPVVRLLQLEHARADALAPLLGQVLAGLGAAGPQAPGGAPAPQVFPEPATNQLVFLGPPGDLEEVRALVEDLDRRREGASGRYRIYRCRHARAPHLEEKLGELLGVGTGGEGQGTVVGASPGPRGRAATRIVSDERSNSLLLQADPDVMQEALRLLGELDRPKRRVAIEVEVWEIAGPTDSLVFGVELAGVPNAHPGSTRPAGLTSFGLTTPTLDAGPDGAVRRIGRAPALSEGLTAVLTRGAYDRIPIVLRAVQQTGRSTLVSRPFAVTNDHTAASFNLQDSRPVPRQSVSNGVSLQDVEYLDADTTLEITPHVNSEGNLTLETSITLSSFSEAVGAAGAPGRNSRSYTGEVTVPNGHYVAFGGLEVEREQTSETKVPFLGDIPILGHLFKSWSRTRSRSKLYIFVRPTVLASEGFRDDRRLAAELRQQAHVESSRERWLPPLVPDRVRWPTGWGLQDEAFAVFGTGSGDPLR